MATKRDIEGIILGSCLREYREKLKEKDSKWTQQYVAEQIDLDDKHYGKLERGYHSDLRFNTIRLLSKVLGFSIDELSEKIDKELEKQNKQSE
ncbi:Helix-turn-helix [Gracilibacillus ureilyticus]|uniref:Helix-turn-helix n=1 Tax=Gracilibacillus ureilyticus TaxID=531814 RepID=A0A1H9MJ38_9BACI|nr:helix-turn-helix transcriptional regulator [Gracilibacillus ureilyticus]SER23477.1 Helix-turn-helix [Gracilibacillus ureilyticus]